MNNNQTEIKKLKSMLYVLSAFIAFSIPILCFAKIEYYYAASLYLATIKAAVFFCLSCIQLFIIKCNPRLNGKSHVFVKIICITKVVIAFFIFPHLYVFASCIEGFVFYGIIPAFTNLIYYALVTMSIAELAALAEYKKLGADENPPINPTNKIKLPFLIAMLVSFSIFITIILVLNTIALSLKYQIYIESQAVIYSSFALFFIAFVVTFSSDKGNRFARTFLLLCALAKFFLSLKYLDICVSNSISAKSILAENLCYAAIIFAALSFIIELVAVTRGWKKSTNRDMGDGGNVAIKFCL